MNDKNNENFHYSEILFYQNLVKFFFRRITSMENFLSFVFKFISINLSIHGHQKVFKNHIFHAIFFSI